MKRVFFVLSIMFFMLFCQAQNTVSFKDIELGLSEHAYVFEGYYSISNTDSVFLGTTYAITYFDPESETVALCLPTGSEYPLFVFYCYNLNSDNIRYGARGDILIKSEKISYSAKYSDNNFYVIMKLRTDHGVFIYDGIFETEEDLD